MFNSDRNRNTEIQNFNNKKINFNSSRNYYPKLFEFFKLKYIKKFNFFIFFDIKNYEDPNYIPKLLFLQKQFRSTSLEIVQYAKCSLAIAVLIQSIEYRKLCEN